MLCNGSHIKGIAQANLGTVTETMQRILAESERQKLVRQDGGGHHRELPNAPPTRRIASCARPRSWFRSSTRP